MIDNLPDWVKNMNPTELSSGEHKYFLIRGPDGNPSHIIQVTRDTAYVGISFGSVEAFDNWLWANRMKVC